MRVQDLLALDGKVAIVTGGGRGLGEQMARALAEAGASVVVCSRKVDACAAVAAEIAALGGPAHALAIDVTDPAQVRHLVEETVGRFGAVDIVVNNAGTT